MWSGLFRALWVSSTTMREFNILNLGAGWQSSKIFLDSCRGNLPKFDAAIFADGMDGLCDT